MKLREVFRYHYSYGVNSGTELFISNDVKSNLSWIEQRTGGYVHLDKVERRFELTAETEWEDVK